MVLSIASVVFREGNKWRLSDGENTFYATIEDEAFLARMRQGSVSFRSGDMLRCRMEVTQVRRGGRLHTERRVLEVLEHIPTEIRSDSEKMMEASAVHKLYLNVVQFNPPANERLRVLHNELPDRLRHPRWPRGRDAPPWVSCIRFGAATTRREPRSVTRSPSWATRTSRSPE